jgi:outer membrane protein OmpA-like peptidoglycan-associated protein
MRKETIMKRIYAQPAMLFVPLAALLAAGCATKGYVNDQIAEVRQEHATMQSETASLRNSTRDALSRASTAFDAADEARDLALGRAGLEEVNRYSVHFAFDSSVIDEGGEATLDRAASEIQDHPEVIVDVYGFADPTGPDTYNLELGNRRAMEVLRYLLEAAPNQLSRYAAVSYGERNYTGMAPDGNSNEQSRRVVVSLIRRTPLEDAPPPSAQVVPGD